MSNETERDIEKKLKAYAKQRRDEAGAPRAMDGASRRTLREEALRVHGASRRGAGFWESLWLLRRRWAMVAGVAALVALAGWIMLPGPQPELAKLAAVRNLETFQSKGEPTLEPANAPAAAEQKLADVPGLDGVAKYNAAARDENGVVSGTILARTNSTALGVSDSLLVAEKEAPASSATAVTATSSGAMPAKPPPVMQPAAPPPVSAAAPTFAFDESATRRGGSAFGGGGGGGGNLLGRAPVEVLRERFARVDAGESADKAKKLNGVEVLAWFQLERTNGVVRVIDNDGSVYAGFILRGGTNGKLPALALDRVQAGVKDVSATSAGFKATLPAGTVSNGAVHGQNIFFRVVGTNRSLNQSVLFTGNWEVGEMPGVPALSLPVAGVGGKLKVETKTLQVEFPGDRVMGRVIIGGTNILDINAESAKP